ncbi:metallophosphoesterase [Chitinimonas viridis]|uniref:Metallophosphoesterase n=1 Tax=Chitinimonas viridis TaxID=664880 RepID=A0ABT8B8U6_9NEIS|nr:metallophosphoesterase [Chitinimonas viridis]MDN3578464.1 metallophosphoesterase [Chitinimonas viridis]
MRLAPLLLSLACLVTWADDSLNDGPYVIHQGQTSEAAWVCQGRVQRLPVQSDRKLAIPCGELKGLALNRSNPVAPDIQPQPQRWAALSDIHGQAGIFQSLLKAQGVIDGKGNWAWGKGVLVIAGDIFDRGPTVNEALWQVYQLEQQARAAGGAVHFVLGNHEAMVLRGDLRYIHPRYQAVAQLLGRSYDQLYGRDTELGQWLRNRATVLKLGDTVFLHGGLHPELAQAAIDLKHINQRFRERLGASKAELAQDPEASYLMGSKGPLWYRGYFLPERATLADVEALLDRLGARRIVVGHTTQRELVSLYGGRVIGVDAGIKDGERGELLLWQDGKLWRGTMDGRRSELAAGEDSGGVLPGQE